MSIDYSGLPEHMIDEFQRWIEHGIPPGDFGMAVIHNNLREAFLRADEINTAKMRDIVLFFWNEAPADCWGSEDRAEQWQLMHRRQQDRRP